MPVLTTRGVWLDLSAGVAGDMLLGALLDAGASLAAVREAVEAVVPGAVGLELSDCERGGLRAAGFRFVALDLGGIQSGAFTLPLVGVTHGR